MDKPQNLKNILIVVFFIVLALVVGFLLIAGMEFVEELVPWLGD